MRLCVAFSDEVMRTRAARGPPFYLIFVPQFRWDGLQRSVAWGVQFVVRERGVRWFKRRDGI